MAQLVRRTRRLTAARAASRRNSDQDRGCPTTAARGWDHLEDWIDHQRAEARKEAGL